MPENIIHNLNVILKRIENACINAGRNPKEVKLLMATKTVSTDRIKIALQTVQTLIA